MARNQGRVQTQDLGLRQAIQPQGLPGSTYVRPPEAPRTNSLLIIAEALSTVHHGLGNYAARMRHDEKTAKAEAEDGTKMQAEIDAATLTGPEWAQKYSTLDPDQKKFYGAAGGMRQADLSIPEMAAAYDAIEDKDSVDIVKWADDYRRQKLASIDSPEGKQAYIRGTDNAFNTLINGHQTYLGKRLGQEKVENLGSQYNLVIQEGKRKGWSPKLLQQNLGAISSDAKKHGGLTGEENDQVLYNMAEVYAQKGDTETVEAILGAPRGGRGALLQDTKYGSNAYKLKEIAYNKKREGLVRDTPLKKGEMDLAAQRGQLDAAAIQNSPFHTDEEKTNLYRANETAKHNALTEAEKARALEAAHTQYDVGKRDASRQMYNSVMSKDGPAMVFVDKPIWNRDGKAEENYSAKNQKDDLISYHEKETTARAQQRVAKGEDPETVAMDMTKEHLEFYTRLREPRAEWKSWMSNSAMSVSSALAAKGKIPTSVKQGYTVYSALMKNAPGLVDEMVTDKNTRLLFETYKTVSQSSDNTNDDAAWFQANQIVQMSIEGKLPRVSFSDEEFRSKVGDDIQGSARVEISRYAEILVQTGADKADALERAHNAIVGKTYQKVSGRLLYTGYKELPPNVVELIEDKLDTLADQFGTVRAHGESKVLYDEGEDLYVSQLGGSRDEWIVHSAETNLPITDEKGKMVTITLAELNRMNQQRSAVDSRDGVMSVAESQADDAARGRSKNILWSTDNLLGLKVPFALGWMTRNGEIEATYQQLKRDNMIRDRESSGARPTGNPTDYRAKGKNPQGVTPGKHDNFGISPNVYKRPTGNELLAGLTKVGQNDTAMYVARTVMASPILMAAKELGISPVDLATVISYETGGKFSTSIMGGKGGRYMGLIQFGPTERKVYGAHAGQSPEEQMKAVVRYLKDRGLKPGMDILDLYSTINAGRPGLYNRSDRKGATVRTHVRDMLAGRHRRRAEGMFRDLSSEYGR